MSGGQRQALKKPWELRYVLLSNTMLRWMQPVSVYLLERIGSSGKVWLVCRPALDPEQETEPRFQLPGATEDEYICFEQVDFSTLRAEDDFPLGQPGPMPDAIMFDHISAREESPYTRANLLAVCPRELRATRTARSARWSATSGGQGGVKDGHGSVAFDDSDPAGISASDRELIAELMKAQPKDSVARPLPSTVPEADASPQLPVNEMLQRATLALEQVAGRPSGLFNVEKAGPKFKLLGAQGRVQQDALNKAFNDDPAAVVREFEAAVKSLAAIDPHEPLTGHIIQETWRNHVPAKEHAQIVRTSEAVLDAYLALRQGNVARGMARLALLLAAMEQSVLDQGKWDLRAETLLGLPRAPLHSYRAPTAEQKPSGENKLGPLAQFCSADRSTTALAVYRDNHPVTNR